MLTIIALNDMIVDPERDVDLLSMPEQEAVLLIRKSYNFLSPAINVSIKDGHAYIEISNTSAERVDGALKLYDRAVKHAENGEFNRAIPLFRRALEVLPDHVDARRNLATAYLELGDKEAAKNLLIEVLKLNPKDASAYTRLGNIAFLYGNDLVRGEKWYRRAYELNPQDAILLTNYGVLMLKKGAEEQATEFFERAIEADPQYPNSYYKLALFYLNVGKSEQSLSLFDEMFSRAKLGNVRAVSLYSEARRTYLEVNRRLADQSYPQMMQAVEERKNVLEAETGGYPIELVEDNALQNVAAVSQTAWKHRRARHLIRYRIKARGDTPHLIARQLENIRIEYEARKIARNRILITTARNIELAHRQISDDVLHLQERGWSKERINDRMGQIIPWLINQLFNTPMDMFGEHHLYHDFAAIRPSQFIALYSLQADALKVFTSKEIKAVTPRLIFRANSAMNCAFALFVDDLYSGRTDYAGPFRTSDIFATGQKLFGIWQEVMEHAKPGDEYALVDEFSRVLKLQDWYEWKADEGTGFAPEDFLVQGDNSSAQDLPPLT